MPWELVEVHGNSQGRSPNHYAPALQLRFIAATESFSAPLPTRFHQKLERPSHVEPRGVRTDNLFQKAAAEHVFRSPDLASSSLRKHAPVSSGVKRLIISPRAGSTDMRRAASDHLTPLESVDNVPSATPRTAPKASPRVIMSPRIPANFSAGLSRGIRTPRSRIEEDSQWMKRKNTIGQLMKQLQAKSWNSRKLALESLAVFVAEDVSVLDGVLGHLESKVTKTRETAVWAISRIVEKGDPQAVSKLTQRLEHDAPQVRLAALSALSQVANKGDAETVAGLVERLTHSDWRVREVAADALAQVAGLGDGVAIEGLIALLRDKDWRVHPVALEALETLVDRSMPSLLPLLNYLSNHLQANHTDNEKGRAPLRVFNIMTSVINPTTRRCQTCTASADPDLICTSCVDRIDRWITTALLPPFWIAFLMGGHSRLGSGSLIYHLDSSLYPLILRHSRFVCRDRE